MNSEQFVQAIKSEVRDVAIQNTIDDMTIIHPTDSRRHEKQKYREFYAGLEDKQKALLRELITEAVDDTIFGFLCVLDGVRSIEEYDEENDPRLELWHKSSDASVLINGTSGPELRDLIDWWLD